MKRSLLSLGMIFLSLFLVSVTNAQSVVMNETYTRGVAGDLDWIELYNPQSVAVDVSGYKIYDSGAKAGTKSKKLFPAGDGHSGQRIRLYRC
jgi:predicted extracellular nuclease